MAKLYNYLLYEWWKLSIVISWALAGKCIVVFCLAVLCKSMHTHKCRNKSSCNRGFLKLREFSNIAFSVLNRMVIVLAFMPLPKVILIMHRLLQFSFITLFRINIFPLNVLENKWSQWHLSENAERFFFQNCQLIWRYTGTYDLTWMNFAALITY